MMMIGVGGRYVRKMLACARKRWKDGVHQAPREAEIDIGESMIENEMKGGYLPG
jgi:hypothetical protein